MPGEKPKKKKSYATSGNNAGRPSKLNPKLQKKLITLIKEGHYFITCCNACGISYHSFRQWMVKGEHEEKGKYRNFFDAVKQAEAEAEINLERAVIKAAFDPEKPAWQAAMTYLERRHYDRWGQRKRLEHTGDASKPVVVNTGIDLSHLSSEELKILEKVVNRNPDIAGKKEDG